MYAKPLSVIVKSSAAKFRSVRITRMTALFFRSIALTHHAGMRASVRCTVRRPRPISGIPELLPCLRLVEH